MSEIAIFSFGSVLFIIVTWATFVFGLRRIHELQLDDMAEVGRYSVERADGLTEIYVTEVDRTRPGSRE